MTAKRYASGLLLLLLLGTGCGENCEELCESRRLCRDARSDVDCVAQCDELEALAEDADCSDQLEALNECVANQDDICDEDPEACESQSRAYTECMSDYCDDHECTE